MYDQRQHCRTHLSCSYLTPKTGARDSRLPAQTRRVLFTLLTVLALLASPLAMASVSLESDSSLAEAGFYNLSWHTDEFDQFELQESAEPSFTQGRTIYHGPDLATIISGRRDGDYYYRLRGIGANGKLGAWSETVKVTVQHHPLSRALLFFIAGAIVFFATLFVIIRGPRQQD